MFQNKAEMYFIDRKVSILSGKKTKGHVNTEDPPAHGSLSADDSLNLHIYKQDQVLFYLFIFK